MIKKYLGLISITSIVMFNVLQADQEKDPNPYNRWKRQAYQKEIEQYGSQSISEEDQEKMIQVLHIMEANGGVPCKYLNQKMIEEKKKGVVTKNGIWIDPTLSESESNYQRHKLAKEYWEKTEKYPNYAQLGSIIFGGVAIARAIYVKHSKGGSGNLVASLIGSIGWFLYAYQHEVDYKKFNRRQIEILNLLKKRTECQREL